MELALPHNIELEKAVLGALLIEKESFSQVDTILNKDCFYLPLHQIVFTAIAEMHKEKKQVDILTVCERISKLKLKGISLYEITNLTANVATAGHIKTHAVILVELSIKRSLVNTAQTVISKAGELETDDLMNILRANFNSIDEHFVNDTPVSLKEYLPIVNERLKHNDSNFGLTSGFPTLDSKLGGFKPGRMYVIGGRPGQGKTSLALFAAVENARRGNKILFFSAEQTHDDLIIKIIGNQSGLGHMYLDSSILKPDDWTKLDHSFSKIQVFSGDIWIKDNPKNIQHIAAIIRNQIKHTGLDLVIVDYLQLIPSANKGNIKIREQEVAEISRTLKQIALSENIPVIALSQLNRDAKGKPQLQHLRESGSIEQDADVVIFVYRPAMEGEGTNFEYGELLVQKNRRGKTGMVEFYNKDMTQFRETPFF